MLPHEAIMEYSPLFLQARIDLDQKYIHDQLENPTDQSFLNARSVYRYGAHSKVVAKVALNSSPSVDTQEGDTVTGTSMDGDEVVLKSYDTYSSSNNVMTIELQYLTDSCYVGGLPIVDDMNLDGCLANEGTLVIGNTVVQYSYNQTGDNRSVRTLRGFSITANKRMRPDEDKLPYFDEFEKFQAYYGNYDYADRFIMAAFEKRSTDFPNSITDFDFSKYNGDMVALSGKFVWKEGDLNVGSVD